MKTSWTGTALMLDFDSGKSVALTVEETKEFEAWVLKRVGGEK